MGLGRGWACDGIQLNCSKTRPWCKDRPSGAFAECGPSRAEQGRLGLSGVGEGLGMHWDSIGGAAWGRFGPSEA